MNSHNEQTYYKRPFFGVIEQESTGEKRRSGFVGAVKASGIIDLEDNDGEGGGGDGGSGGGTGITGITVTGVDNGGDEEIPKIRYNDMLMNWIEIHNGEFVPTHYYQIQRNRRSWGELTRGPDNGPNLGVGNHITDAFTDSRGVLHLLYIDTSNNLKYCTYDKGSGWSSITTIGVSYAYKYINTQEYNDEIYVFFFRNVSGVQTPSIWRKSTDVITTVPVTGSFNSYGEQGSRAFLISSSGKFYVAISVGYLIILTSEDLGYAWNEYRFTTGIPYENQVLLNSENMTFYEDKSGIVYIVMAIFEIDGADTWSIVQMRSSSWRTTTSPEILHTFDTSDWSNKSINFLISPNGTHHIVCRGPNSGNESEFLGYSNTYATAFDEALPLNQWTTVDLNEPENSFFYSSGFYENPDDGINRSIVEPVDDFPYLWLYAEADPGLPKTGYMQWNVPGSYTDVEVTMRASMTGPSGAGGILGMYINGNGESDWKDFEGYIITFQKPSTIAAGAIRVYKKYANYGGGGVAPSALIYMGGVFHNVLDSVATIQATLTYNGQANRLAVRLLNSDGFTAASRGFFDITNPIRQGIANKYGIYHQAGTYATDEDTKDRLNRRVYSFKVVDLNSGSFDTPTTVTPGLWHIYGVPADWEVSNILETGTSVDEDASFPYLAFNGDIPYIIYYVGDKVYVSEYVDGSWTPTLAHTAPLGAGTLGYATIVGEIF